MELKYKIKKWNQIHSRLYPFETKCFLAFLFLNQAYSSYFNSIEFLDTTQKPESYITSAFIWGDTKEGNKFWSRLNSLWNVYLNECRKRRKTNKNVRFKRY